MKLRDLVTIPAVIGYMAGAVPVPGWLFAPLVVALGGPVAAAGVAAGACAWGVWAVRCAAEWAAGRQR
jgi:hypothetical protein